MSNEGGSGAGNALLIWSVGIALGIGTGALTARLLSSGLEPSALPRAESLAGRLGLR